MENKRFIEPKYTEEQKAFILKYGESQLDSWERMDDSQKKEYHEIEDYYSIFANLLSEHYEDLKLYALMYRNVPLYNCDKDPISVLFFASNQNEIIGFKKKLEADKDSNKAKIAFLYYDNAALFPKVVRKYIGKNLKPIQSTMQVIYRSLLNDFNTGNYNHIFSICDLSEIECLNILSNEKSFKHEYLSLYDDCEEIFDTPDDFSDIKDFIVKYFIPNLLKDNVSFQYKRLLRYLKMKYPKKWMEEITLLKRDYKEYIEQINSYTIEKNKQILHTHKEQEKPELEYISVYSSEIERLKTSKRMLEVKLSSERNQPKYSFIDNISIEEYKELQDKCKNKIREVESKIYVYESLEREQYNKWLEQKRERENRQRQEELERFKKEAERINYLKEDAFEILILRIKSSGLSDFIYLNHKV